MFEEMNDQNARVCWVENETKRLEADARALGGQVFPWSRETVAAATSHSVEPAPTAKPRAQRQTTMA